jgi:hypothetical protein
MYPFVSLLQNLANLRWGQSSIVDPQLVYGSAEPLIVGITIPTDRQGTCSVRHIRGTAYTGRNVSIYVVPGGQRGMIASALG